MQAQLSRGVAVCRQMHIKGVQGGDVDAVLFTLN